MNKEIEETRKHMADQARVRAYADALGERLRADGYTFAFFIYCDKCDYGSRRWGGVTMRIAHDLGVLVSNVTDYFAGVANVAVGQLKGMGIDNELTKTFEDQPEKGEENGT
jgi:hypothetical protein